MNKKEADLDHLLQFRSTTELANGTVISINTRGEIHSWNTSATKMFGFPQNEAVGKNIELIIPDQHLRAHREGDETGNFNW